MSFGALLAEVASDHRRVVVYAPDDAGTDLEERLATRNLTVEHRRLPRLDAEAFVVVRDADGFHGALSLSDLLTFLAPPIPRPMDRAALSEPYRAIYDLLDNTVFVTLDRRQLLATSRELEDRAWRTGTGRLHAGFQRADAFEAQRDVYEELAAATDIDVHVYLPAAAAPSGLGRSLTVHTEPATLIERYWFILFDGGTQNCALVAKATGEKQYRGFWTYDADLVARGFEAVDAAQSP